MWSLIAIMTAAVIWLSYKVYSHHRVVNQLKSQIEKLEQEKYLFDFLMNNLPISIYFKDKDSRFIKVSKHMTDQFKKEMIGLTDFHIHDARHAREAFEDEQQIIRTAIPKIDFVEKESRNHNEMWVSTSKMPFLNNQGEVIGTFGISKDITEVKRQNQRLQENEEKIKIQNMKLQEQQEELASQNEELIQSQEEISAQRDLLGEQYKKLQEAAEVIKTQNEAIQLRNINLEGEIERRTKDLVEYNQQLEQFAFITAHNLRAPVARILGLGNVLKLPNQSKEDQASSLQKLLMTVTELDQVIRDLNVILEVKKGLTQVRSKVEFQIELEKILSNLRSEIEDVKAVIKSDFTQAPSIISFSPYVDSILFNLISNAIKYHHPERQLFIEVKATVDEGYTILTISDNGLGIDVEKYGRQMFTLYKRFHNHVEGKGMGLYLVKSQITTLGGYIHIKSKPNEGTTMMVYFKT